MARAKELSFSARTFDGVEARMWGLAALGGPLEELDNLVTSTIEKMAANSSESFVAYKDLYAATERLSADQGLVYEADSDYSFTDTGERLTDFR
jgi:enoyl-CoA hydratase/carnithine racemase